MRQKIKILALSCMLLLLTGCSSVIEIASGTVPLATTDYTDYTEITSPETVTDTEKIKPTFPPRETETIPEAAVNYYWGEEKWTRVIVIYNDSYSMLLWIKNYEGYDSYTSAWPDEQAPCPQEAPF